MPSLRLKRKEKEEEEKKLHNRFLWRGHAIKKMILFFSRVILRPLRKAMKTSLGLLIVFCFVLFFVFLFFYVET